MYNRSFGLHRNPFDLTADPSFLYLTQSNREVLAGLSYAILSRKGLVVLASDAGMGKTTLLARILHQMPPGSVRTSFILNPTLSAAEFLEMTLLDFGFDDVPDSKARRIVLLQQMLLENHAAGKVSVLIVDEAHKLSADLLEEIRLLSNFECAQEKLLQVVLSGQLELVNTLDQPDLWQLKQRVALRLAIEPLNAVEVQEYMEHRWKLAGAPQPIPFAADALQTVAGLSLGIPRVINGICNTALTLAFAEGKSQVTKDHVTSAALEMRLPPTTASIPPAVDAEPGPKMPAYIEQGASAGMPLATLNRYGNTERRRSWWAWKWKWSAVAEPGAEKV